MFVTHLVSESPARERQSKAGGVPAARVAHGLNNTLMVTCAAV